jgi:predicted phage tail protein
MEQVRTVKLYGKLGAKYGRTHRYVLSSPRDALRALIAMVPGFERELMTSRERGIEYAVLVGNRNIGENQLTHPSGSDDIRIAPIVSGSKKAGLFQTIAGIALVVVGAVSTYFGNPYGTQMMLMGASMALGGIAQMLAPHSSPNSATQTTSYDFNGAQNTTYQGGPVPLLYGRMRVGSTVISEGLLAQDGTVQLVGGNYVITS